jgi:hypothetical protein
MASPPHLDAASVGEPKYQPGKLASPFVCGGAAASLRCARLGGRCRPGSRTPSTHSAQLGASLGGDFTDTVCSARSAHSHSGIIPIVTLTLVAHRKAPLSAN